MQRVRRVDKTNICSGLCTGRRKRGEDMVKGSVDWITSQCRFVVDHVKGVDTVVCLWTSEEGSVFFSGISYSCFWLYVLVSVCFSGIGST